MSASRIFLQNFEDLKGLDYKKTALTGDIKEATSLTNWRYGEGRSIRGRNGSKVLGQPNAFTSIHNYTYFEPSTGATTEEIIGLNHHLWRFTSSTISIGRVAGSTAWFAGMTLNAVNTALTSGSTNWFKFILTQGGSAITLVHPITGESNAYLGLGMGVETDQAPTAVPTSGLITIMDLCQAIDATANFTCSIPTKTARVNVNQTWTAGNTINVDPGHTVSAGDFISFWNHTQSRLDFRRVSAAAATTLTMGLGQSSCDVKNAQVLGIGAAPAASIPIGDATFSNILVGADPTKTITFYYWEPIFGPRGQLDFQDYGVYESFDSLFDDCFTDRASADFNLPCLVNGDQSAHIFTQNTSTTTKQYTNYPCKYDGLSTYRSGQPSTNDFTLAIGGGTGLTGLYKYATRYVHKDKRGIRTSGDTNLVNVNEKSVTVANQFPRLTLYPVTLALRLDGKNNTNKIAITATATSTTVTVNDTSHLNVGDYILLFNAVGTYVIRTVVTIPTATTFTISGAAVTTTNTNPAYINPNLGFNDGGAMVNGAGAASVSTIPVFQNHNIYVGDVIYFYDTLHSCYTERTITSVTATTITFAVGAVVSLPNAALISKGARIEIFRTNAGGNVYYKVAEIPAPFLLLAAGGLGAITFDDNLPDTNLGPQLDELPIGKERGLPPKAAIGTLHQGLMAMSHIKDEPNAIYFSNIDSLETVSAASNSFDVPSNSSGLITAIFSDTSDRLLCFKNRAIYEAIGDLDSGAFIVNPIREGDFGVASQTSLQRINGTVIGVGPMGFIGIQGGNLLLDDYGDSIVGAPINTAIRNLLSGARSVSVNDYSNGIYLCYVPSANVFGASASSSGQQIYALDYLNGGKWFDYSWSTPIEPSASIIMSGGYRYHLSALTTTNVKSGHLFIDGLSIGVNFRFADNTLAIPLDWTTGWEHLQEPDTFKEFLEMAIWSLPGVWEEGLPDDPILGGSFTLTITEESDLFDSDQGFTPVQTYSITIVNSINPSENRKVLKLKNLKVKMARFRFRMTTIGQTPYISGVSVDIGISNKKETLREGAYS